eukprot:4325248-Amphidinium_carterae.1
MVLFDYIWVGVGVVIRVFHCACVTHTIAIGKDPPGGAPEQDAVNAFAACCNPVLRAGSSRDVRNGLRKKEF